MNIINTLRLNSNPKIEIDFSGGTLSSDSGLFLMKEFLHQIGFMDILSKYFVTTDPASYRIHTDVENLLQALYQIFAGYFEDDRADKLVNESVITACVGKESLASQPTMSRFFNRLDEKTLDQFNEILRQLRKLIYKITGTPNYVMLDIDTTLLNTYGNQEGAEWNYHYQDDGYHPQLCFDCVTGDLIKMQLRKGTQYCSTGIAEFMKPIFEEYTKDYSYTNIMLRGDSGYATPDLYELCEQYGVAYFIRLKSNVRLYSLAAGLDEKLTEQTRENMIDHSEVYGEFMYQADSWSRPRRVVCKIEKPKDSMEHRYTFVVTNTDSLAKLVIKIYCGRGAMENLIKECKNDFDFAAVSSKSMVVNDNRLQIHGLAYTLFNYMRRLVFPAHLIKARMETIRLNLIKIASRVVKHGRRLRYRLCSSCTHQEEFVEIMNNIHSLHPKAI